MESVFASVIGRAKEVLGVTSDVAVAAELGMKPAAFNNRKKSDSLPYDELVKWASTRNVDINWLLTGQGGRKERGGGHHLPIDPRRAQKDRRERLLTIFDALDEPGQRTLISQAEAAEELAAMRRRIAELEAGAGASAQVFHAPVKHSAGRDMTVHNNSKGAR